MSDNSRNVARIKAQMLKFSGIISCRLNSFSCVTPELIYLLFSGQKKPLDITVKRLIKDVIPEGFSKQSFSLKEILPGSPPFHIQRGIRTDHWDRHYHPHLCQPDREGCWYNQSFQIHREILIGHWGTHCHRYQSQRNTRMHHQLHWSYSPPDLTGRSHHFYTQHQKCR